MTRALIADDERLMREQLRSRLAEVWPELEIVAEARNGIEAVELATRHRPDLVFLDIRMPGMTGVEAARQIAQLPTDDEADGWPGCEIVFITAEKYTRVQTAQLEALIRKPIKELIEELDMNLFWQIHRSTLVNTKAIAGVSRDLRGRQLVSVRGHDEKLEVSRSFAGLFKG